MHRCLGSLPEQWLASSGEEVDFVARSGTVAPMQRYAVSKEQWLRCRGSEDHADADTEGVEDVDDAERRGVKGLNKTRASALC